MRIFVFSLILVLTTGLASAAEWRCDYKGGSAFEADMNIVPLPPETEHFTTFSVDTNDQLILKDTSHNENYEIFKSISWEKVDGVYYGIGILEDNPFRLAMSVIFDGKKFTESAVMHGSEDFYGAFGQSVCAKIN